MPARDRLSWFRWSPQDYLADSAVRAMTFEERGRYVEVLMTLYLKNTAVASEDEIRVWAGYTESDWPEHRATIARAFKVRRDATWVQRRVEIEIRAARNRVRKASENGRAGASARWGSVAVLQRTHGKAKAT